jgi:hypothetical protein
MTSDRTILDRARQNGYLNAAHPDRSRLIHDYGFWCWKLRVPLVGCEPESPRPRRGRVHLDRFTTRYVLTARGLDELRALADTLQIPARVTISRYDGLWEGVPKPRLADLARAVFRAATRFGNFELRPAGRSPELAKLIAAIHDAAQTDEALVA